MKYTRKKKIGSKTLKEKREQKVSLEKGLKRNKRSDDLRALVQTWDEDLCE